MKDGNMKATTAVKLLYQKGKGRCHGCGMKFGKKEAFNILPNEAKNKNLIADGEEGG